MRPQLGATDVYALWLFSTPGPPPVSSIFMHARPRGNNHACCHVHVCTHVVISAARYLLGEARDVVAVDFEIYIR
jgi:hypothetical protein